MAVWIVLNVDNKVAFPFDNLRLQLLRKNIMPS